MVPGASPASPASPGADDLDRWDVAVGTKAVPRGSRVRSGGPLCLPERRAETYREAALADEEGSLNPKPPLPLSPRKDQHGPSRACSIRASAAYRLGRTASALARAEPAPAVCE